MKKINISIIAAMAENSVIGDRGRIPWHIREDLIRFRDLTLNKTVIVGRKTFESLISYYQKSQRPFPKRNYMIVTKDINFKPKLTGLVDAKKSMFVVVSSVEKAIIEAKRISKGEVFLIGGASIYEQGIKYADKLYLTIVKGRFKGDTFFPDYLEFKKVVFKKESRDKNYRYTFLELEKRKSS